MAISKPHQDQISSVFESTFPSHFVQISIEDPKPDNSADSMRITVLGRVDKATVNKLAAMVQRLGHKMNVKSTGGNTVFNIS